MEYRRIAPLMGNLWSPIAAVTSRWQERSNVQIAVADGSRIAFVSSLYGQSEIFVMNADGSQQRRLTNNTSEDYSPNW